MRFHIIFLFLFSLATNTFAQNLIVGTFRTYKGNIGPYPITLHLHKSDSSLSGSYCYDKRQTPIDLYGTPDKNPSIVTLSTMNETFSLLSDNELLLGTWKKGTISHPCTLKTTKPVIDLEYYYLSDKKELRPGMNASPTVSYTVSTLWPKGNDSRSNVLKKIILKELGLKGNVPIGGLIAKGRDDCFDEYFRENGNLPDSMLGFGYTNESMVAVELAYATKKLFCLKSLSYSYSGGAHGMTHLGYINMDGITQKVFAMQDVINKKQTSSILRLLDKKYRQQKNIPEGTKLSDAGLFDNSIPQLSSGFLLSDKGITFIYNQYEIAPYSSGIIDIYVTYEELKPFLMPQFSAFLVR